MVTITRRALLCGAAAVMTAPAGVRAAPVAMVVNKDPNCGCCSGWVDHVKDAGFEVRVVEMADLAPLKSRLGIPRLLSSLLSERPTATGLAVPGMPVGSPGMEVPGAPDDTYAVVLFGTSGQRVYARFKGAQELS